MAKESKKHSKKGKVSEDLLDVAALSVKKFRKVTKQIGKLSTGQKLVGGVALLATGLTYLASKQRQAAPATAAPVEANGDAATEPDAANAADAAPKKTRKSPKTRFSTEHS